MSARELAHSISIDISVEEVSRTFGRRRALTRVTFKRFARHASWACWVPNGAGKSTMLAILATLMRPTAGTVRFGGLIHVTAGASLRSRIGVLGHDLFLYPELTARENLAFFAGLYDARRSARRGSEPRCGAPDSPIALTTPSAASRAACGSASRSSGR